MDFVDVSRCDSSSLCTPRYAIPLEEYFLSAQFDEGDPAYEWLVLFLVCIPVHDYHRSMLNLKNPSDRGGRMEEIPRIYRYR